MFSLSFFFFLKKFYIKLLSLSLLFMSVILVIMSQSSFVWWFAMEVSSFSFFIFLLSYKNSVGIESAMKYFMIQSIGAMIWLYMMFSMNYFWLGMSLSIFLKMGMFPFQKWFMEMMGCISVWAIYLLMTVQKIVPLVVFIKMLKFFPLSDFHLLFSLLLISYFFLSFQVLFSNIPGDILAVSSINNFSILLMMSLVKVSFWTQILFLFYYMLFGLLFCSILVKLNTKLFYTSLYFFGSFSIFLMMICFNFACLPPFLAFFIKYMWMIFFSKKLNLLLLFFCFSMILSSLFYTLFQIQFFWKKSNFEFYKFSILTLSKNSVFFFVLSFFFLMNFLFILSLFL